MRRLFGPWFQSKPPLLGAILDGLVMAVFLSPFVLFGGSPARQVPLFVIVIALFIFFSYGGRIRMRGRTTPGGNQHEDTGGEDGPRPHSPE